MLKPPPLGFDTSRKPAGGRRASNVAPSPAWFFFLWGRGLGVNSLSSFWSQLKASLSHQVKAEEQKVVDLGPACSIPLLLFWETQRERNFG